MTEAEQVLWTKLRAHRLNGLGFRRQVPIGSFIVDFVCHDHRLIVELDGGQQWLNSKGYRVLRFWNSDVLRNCEPVLERILETITQPIPPSRSATPTDLPLQGGGGASRGTEP